MFDLVLRTPRGLTEKDGLLCLDFEEDGEPFHLIPTEDEIAEYHYHQHLRNHCFDDGGYYVTKFTRDLKIYPDMDIDYENNKPSGLGE